MEDPKPTALCPVCGWNRWLEINFGSGEENVASIRAFRAPHEVGAAPFACRRCGFVRLHVKLPNPE